MMRTCQECGRTYNDEHCSTLCPHKGIGFCVVCDCVVCICDENTTNKRSNKYREPKVKA